MLYTITNSNTFCSSTSVLYTLKVFATSFELMPIEWIPPFIFAAFFYVRNTLLLLKSKICFIKHLYIYIYIYINMAKFHIFHVQKIWLTCAVWITLRKSQKFSTTGSNHSRAHLYNKNICFQNLFFLLLELKIMDDNGNNLFHLLRFCEHLLHTFQYF